MADNDNEWVWEPAIGEDGLVHDPTCKGIPCDCFKDGFTRVQTVSKQALSDFTRVCDQTGMSEKLRKE